MNIDDLKGLDEATKNEIEELTQVTRRASSDENFALAQRKLAELYYKHGLFEEAIRTSKLIEPQDNSEYYVKAQYNIGAAYNEQGKHEEALAIWLKIEEDFPEVYCRAQYNIGNIQNNLGNFKEAKKAWANINKNNSPEVYAKAQSNIASTLSREGKEDEAIQAWGNVERNGYPEAYAQAQFNLGVFSHRKGDTYVALEIWSKIEVEDSLDFFNLAQYNICTVSMEDTPHQNITKAEKALSSIINGYQYEKRCLMNICKLLKTYSTDIGKNLLLLFIHVSRIIEILKIDVNLKLTDNKPVERKLAHYTGINTVELLLTYDKKKNLPSPFRLNTINNVNDPSEGELLLESLKGISGEKLYSSRFDENLSAFISCFTFNNDSLNQFRLYGKKDNKEASGVSLVFNKEFFQKYNFIGGLSYINSEEINATGSRDIAEKNIKEKADSLSNKIEKQPVMRCAYIDPYSDYIHLAQRNRLTFFREFNDETLQVEGKLISKAEHEWQNYQSFINKKTKNFNLAFKYLKKDYKAIIKEINRIKRSNSNLSDNIETLLNEILLPLKYLIKHSAFQEEQECRMIYITSLNNDKVKMDFGKSLYVEYEPEVKSNLDKIYIAPAATKYRPYLKKLLCDTDVKIELSNNPYRHT